MWQLESEKNEPGKRIWSIWQTIVFGVVILFASIAAQMIVALIYSFIEVMTNPDLDKFEYSENLATNGLFFSLATIVSSIVGTVFIIVFIKIRKGITIKEYLSLKPVSIKQIFLITGICMSFLVLSELVGFLLGSPDDTEFTTDVYNTSTWLPLLIIAAVFFAPVFEEAFFRGFLLTGLRQSPVGNIGAIAITSILWAVIHMQYGLFGISLIFSFGILLAVVKLKTGSLWGPLIMHSLWNLIVVIGASLYA